MDPMPAGLNSAVAMSLPSSRCFGRIGALFRFVMKRNGANGFFRCTTAVSGSGVSTEATTWNATRPVGWYFGSTSR